MLPRRTLLIMLLAVQSQTDCARGVGNAPAPARGGSQWCVQRNATVDSAVAVEQAIRFLSSRSSEPLKLGSIRHVDEGFLVSLVPARLIAGGGGLVWVDGETGCPILLIRGE